MPDEKEKKEQLPEIELNINITADSPVTNGEITDYTISNYVEREAYTETQLQEITYDVGGVTHIGHVEIPVNIPELKVYTGYSKGGVEFFKNLTEVYETNGQNNAYEFLKSEIIAAKDNPKKLKEIINGVLDKFVNAYDSNKHHAAIAPNQEEVLAKLMEAAKSGEEIPNAICGPIHDFMRNTLEECGIPAVLLTGKSKDSGGHATLLYQNSDGTYTYNNYGSTSITIKADNIIDAAKEIYKRSGSLGSDGFLSLEGKDSQYVTYSLEREAAFGKEIDKKNHILESPFTDNMPQKPSIGVDVDGSINGNLRVNTHLSRVTDSEKVQRGTTLEVEYKKSGETDVFTNSQSLGAKVEHTTRRTGIEYGGSLIASYTQGNIDLNPANEAIQTNINERNEQYIQQDVGISESSLPELNTNPQKIITVAAQGNVKNVNNINDNVTNVNSATAMTAVGLGISGENSVSIDGRILLESGIGYDKDITPEINAGAHASAGLVLDGQALCPDYKPGILPGTKLNIGGHTNYSPTQNLTLGAKVEGAFLKNKNVTQHEIEAELSGGYRPEGSKAVIFGNAGINIKRENLKISLFNEDITHKTTFSAQAGVAFSRSTFYAGYTLEKDGLNSSRNISTFGVGARYTF